MKLKLAFATALAATLLLGGCHHRNKAKRQYEPVPQSQSQPQPTPSQPQSETPPNADDELLGGPF